MSSEIPEEIPTTLRRVIDSLQKAGYSTSELAELLYVPNLLDHPAWFAEAEESRHLRLIR